MSASRAALPASVWPTATELVPWTDKKGRLHPLRATVFALLCLPALWLGVRWGAGMLGPRAANAAIHSTGYAAVWILIASLVVTPLKALAALPNLVVVRRMTGNAALAYAALHLTLYAADQNWRLLAIASEILSRFYLTIGFAALVGLVLLGGTSTDGWARRLGRTWKRLHRLVYALMALGLVHYVLQSKLDVSQALAAAGVFAWLMLWRALPAGRDRTWLPLLGVSAAAAAVTLAAEFAWYRFGTRIDPWKVVLSEADIAFGLRPAGLVLFAGLGATLLAELRRLGMGAMGQSLGFTVLTYALGGALAAATAFALGWPVEDVTPPGLPPLMLEGGWAALLGLLGVARWALRASPLRRLIDAVWLACLLAHLVPAAAGTPEAAAASAAILAGAGALTLLRVWPTARAPALAMVPLLALLAYEAAALL